MWTGGSTSCSCDPNEPIAEGRHEGKEAGAHCAGLRLNWVTECETLKRFFV